MNAAIFLSLMGLADAVRLPCRYPFELVGDECFYFNQDNRNWRDAQAHCQSHGGYLAVPSNLVVLNNYLLLIVDSPLVWIGGTDLAQEGNWLSFINTKRLYPWLFHPNEPNNAGGNEHCLELWWKGQARLNDNNCDVEQFFVCEKDICPFNDLICPPRYTKVGNECFYISPYTERWIWARLTCQYLFDGDLAVPSNLDFFYEFVGDMSPWIGGTDRAGNWLYLNGSAVNPNSWSPNEPSKGGNEHCLQFMHYRHPPLNNNRCNRFLRYVCEAPPICKSQRTVNNYSNYSWSSTEPISNHSWNYTEPNYFNSSGNSTDYDYSNYFSNSPDPSYSSYSQNSTEA